MKVRESILIFSIISIALANILLNINVQWIACSDHGRDLYYFLKVKEGQMPYRDFVWLYGPLMLYYYDAFYKLLGINILSVKIGQSLLIFFSTLTIYFSVRKIIGPIYAFLSSLYFIFISTCFYWSITYLNNMPVIHFPVRHTYNHTGATFVISLLFLLFVKFINSEKRGYLYLMGFFMGILGGIKINIGVCFFVGTFFFLLFEKNKKDLFVFSFIFFLTSLLIYLPFIYSAEPNMLLKSFMFLYSPAVHFGNIFYFILLPFIKSAGVFRTPLNMVSSLPFLASFVLFLSILLTIFLGIKRDDNFRYFLFFTLITLFLFHEFILVSSVYSLEHFSLPSISILLFLPFTIWRRRFLLIKYILIGFILFAILYNMIDGGLRLQRKEKYWLPFPRANIYVLNHPNWVITMVGVVDFLKKNTRDNEKIIAIPNVPLFSFLSERNNGTPFYSFCLPDRLTLNDENRVIEDIEREKIRFVLISNTTFAFTRKEAGIFGQTHCIKLAKYLERNYSLLKIYGDWNGKVDWLYESIAILKRCKSFKNE
ncbi:MAG: hypothetical protein AB1630_02150 [bacterium]